MSSEKQRLPFEYQTWLAAVTNLKSKNKPQCICPSDGPPMFYCPVHDAQQYAAASEIDGIKAQLLSIKKQTDLALEALDRFERK